MEAAALNPTVAQPFWPVHRDPSDTGRDPAAQRADAAADLLMAALLAGIEATAPGIALFDDASRLIYADRSARAALARAGWSIAAGDLHGPTAGEQAAWLQALREARTSQRRGLFEFAAGAAAQCAGLVPIEIGAQRWIFVTWGRPEFCGPLELQMFAARHGLTYAEVEVLRKLSRSLRPAAIATAHGVSVSTVMTQVASIRSKAWAASVRDLLAMLSRLPSLGPGIAGRGAGEPRLEVASPRSG